jgi:hypothetical protein
LPLDEGATILFLERFPHLDARIGVILQRSIVKLLLSNSRHAGLIEVGMSTLDGADDLVHGFWWNMLKDLIPYVEDCDSCGSQVPGLSLCKSYHHSEISPLQLPASFGERVLLVNESTLLEADVQLRDDYPNAQYRFAYVPTLALDSIHLTSPTHTTIEHLNYTGVFVTLEGVGMEVVRSEDLITE